MVKKAKKVAKRKQSREMVVRTPARELTPMEMIGQMAADPNCDVGKMRELVELRKQIRLEEAAEEFNRAMAIMQTELPTIDQRGRLIIRDKATKAVIQTTPYPFWADISDQIKPILARHGFALNFITDGLADGKINITAILSRGLHEMRSSVPVSPDPTGSKNAAQAIGSATSYGKRYTAVNMLNITSRAPAEMDNDGAGADKVDAEQLKKLQQAIKECGINEARVLERYQIEKLEDLPASSFDQAMKRCSDFGLAKKAAKEAAPA